MLDEDHEAQETVDLSKVTNLVSDGACALTWRPCLGIYAMTSLRDFTGIVLSWQISGALGRDSHLAQ